MATNTNRNSVNSRRNDSEEEEGPSRSRSRHRRVEEEDDSSDDGYDTETEKKGKHKKRKAQQKKAQQKKKSKKNKPKPKLSGGMKANSTYWSVDKVQAALDKDQFLLKNGLESTNDPLLNYYCRICDVYLKATCSGDMTKHCKQCKRHIESRKLFKGKDGKAKPKQRQRQTTDIVTQLAETKHDFFLAVLSSNIPAHAILAFNAKFLYSKKRLQFAQQLPKSDAAFSQSMDGVLKQYQGMIKKKMRMAVVDDPFFHWSCLMDEGSVKGYGCLPVLTATSATDTPVLTTAHWLQNTTNSISVMDAFLANYEFLEYSRKTCVLMLTDDVSYNNCAFESISTFCSFSHLLACPLHSQGNALVSLLKDSGLFDDCWECINEGSKLFKNSADRKNDFMAYMRSHTFEDDGLIESLMEHLDVAQVRDIYDIPDDIDDHCIEERIRARKKEREEKKKKKKKQPSSNIVGKVPLTIEKYLPRCVLLHEPYRLIPNKWFTAVFVIFWWANCLATFIQWVSRFYTSEGYFLKLSGAKILTLKVKFRWLLKYVITRYMSFLLIFQSRKALHHVAYDLIHEYIAEYANQQLTLEDLEEEERELILEDDDVDEVKDEEEEYAEEEDNAIIDIAAFESLTHALYELQDNDSDDDDDVDNRASHTHNHNHNSNNSNNNNHNNHNSSVGTPSVQLVAHMRRSLCIDVRPRQRIKNESKAAKKLWVAAFKDVSVAQKKKLLATVNKASAKYHGYLLHYFKDTNKNMVWWRCARLLDPRNGAHKENIKEAFGAIKFGPNKYASHRADLLKFEREYEHYKRVIIPMTARGDIAKRGSSSYDKLNAVIIEFLKDGDIVKFWRRVPGYKILNVFAVYMLDNPICDVDVERLMSYMKWVCSAYAESMDATTKTAKLFAIWNYWLLKDYFVVGGKR